MPSLLHASTSALLLALATPALAAPQARVISGDSALAECLDDTACEDRVVGVVGETLTEYGFLFQTNPIATSALAAKGRGPVFELRLDTATLGPRNEIERIGPIIPGLPRLTAGWVLGPTNARQRTPQVAAGVTFLPTIRASGRLTTAQVDASVAAPVLGTWLWVGTEGSYHSSRVEIPLFGYESQFVRIEEETGFGVDRTETCIEGETCIDTYRHRVGTARLGLSVEPVPALFAYGRVSLSRVSSRFEVGYDDSMWAVDHFQLGGQGGVGVRAGGYQVVAGAAVAQRPSSLSTDGSRAMVTATVSTSWRLGPTRRRLPPVDDARAPLEALEDL